MVPKALIVLGILIVGVGFWFTLILPFTKARAIDRAAAQIDPVPPGANAASGSQSETESDDD